MALIAGSRRRRGGGREGGEEKREGRVTKIRRVRT